MKKDDFVKIVAVNGDFRYGYISEVQDKGFLLGISLYDEGESKIAYDTAYNALAGEESIDYVSILTEVEKRIVPLLASGCLTNKIASVMSTTPTTVRAQLRTLRLKLHLENRSQLIAFSPALLTRIKKQEEVDRAVEAEIPKKTEND